MQSEPHFLCVVQRCLVLYWLAVDWVRMLGGGGFQWSHKPVRWLRWAFLQASRSRIGLAAPKGLVTFLWCRTLISASNSSEHGGPGSAFRARYHVDLSHYGAGGLDFGGFF
ncbi:hypothetical protein NDU88_007991 [Pleurodeles waltl]|uniref:Secreted protein n=1 Tax=Pleurodeles waltl TaxID=8319 RepID=A0AAV7STX4_PLEWA|nr:hypothetical protein NDU88_007991 [Pleurodeles waltl]